MLERALVVGGGSIGLRHLRNLRSLGAARELALVEPNAERRAVIAKEVEACSLMGSLAEGLAWKPQAAVVASPSHLHVEQALALARAGAALFVEKPLSHDSAGLDVLASEVRERKLTTLVGCNMRFHPGPARVKRLLDEGAVGPVLFARLHCGSYLPEWRPWQDYRTSYSAQSAMGGGVILDCIHEIDLARWMLGAVATVFCVAKHVSALEIDVEDTALIVLSHRAGTLSEVHLDYVQRTYERGCQIVGEHGSIFWEFGKGTRLYDARDKSWTTFPQPDGWDVNEMYVEEMRHFLDCVARAAETTLPIEDAVHVLAVALAAKQASARGASVAMEDRP